MPAPFKPQIFPGALTSKVSGGPVTNQDDPNNHPEDNMAVPWCIDPVVSWLQWECYLETLLDPGTVLHKPLPQSAEEVDTLGTLDMTSAQLPGSTNGANLFSNSTATDVIQRMATSTYRFILRGQALRAGYQVPIPNLISVGGAICVPTNPHRHVNKIDSNLMGGIPLWYAAWELHYICATAPKAKPGTKVAVQNPSAAIMPDAQLPNVVFVPTAPADQNAVQVAPKIDIPNFGNIVSRG